MPLQSRLSRKPVPVDQAADNAAAEATNEDVSPRRRQVAPQPDPQPEPETEVEAAAAPEAEVTEQDEAPAGDPVREEAPAPKPERQRPGPKPGTPRARHVELPVDAAESNDPAVLREVLKGLEATIRERRREYETASKGLVDQYKAVSAKLAEALLV